jgi:hypothetical protein
MRAMMTRWGLIGGAAAMLALVMLPAPEAAGETPAPLYELIGDNEIPHQILDGIVDIGNEVAAFLVRMVPFPF